MNPRRLLAAIVVIALIAAACLAASPRVVHPSTDSATLAARVFPDRPAIVPWNCDGKCPDGKCRPKDQVNVNVTVPVDTPAPAPKPDVVTDQAERESPFPVGALVATIVAAVVLSGIAAFALRVRRAESASA